MNKIETYTQNAINIAKDNSHGYSQINRWGNPDYDCSSLVITVVQNSGIPVKTRGATYTGNMRTVFLTCGFKDVTRYVNLATGTGLKRGDILLNTHSHTEIYIGNNQTVGAHIDENGGVKGRKKGDNTGNEISIGKYHNHPWNCVLRYESNDDNTIINKPKTPTTALIKDVINGKYGNGNARKTALEKMGYNYTDVQNRVNLYISSSTHTKKAVTTKVIKDVINGKYGNGSARKTALENAGYNYNEVQEKVNQYLKK